MKPGIFSISLLKLLLLSAIPFSASSRTFYISFSGDNTADGQSIGTAWQSIAKVNQTKFEAGDSIMFEGGVSFSGSIVNEYGFIGTVDQPIVIGSYGTGRATILSGVVGGLYLDGNNVIVKDMIFNGDGYRSMSYEVYGILGYVDENATGACENIKMANVEVAGYGGWGCLLYTASPSYGFDNLDIQNCQFHDNGYGGMFVYGYYEPSTRNTRTSHNAYLNNNKFFNNFGRSDKTNSWSGCGLVVFGMTGGIIEHCEAFNNGIENGYKHAGPVGIMVGESQRVTIQYCSSHDNDSGDPSLRYNDGGGYCLDGGTEHCVIQYCDSYNNWGAAYGIYQYQTAGPTGYDTIRYCKSTNDAVNDFYGSITLWGADSSNMVKKAYIYKNEINQSIKGRPALRGIYQFIETTVVESNSFCLTNSARFTNPTNLPAGISLVNNLFPCSALPIKIGSFDIKRVQ